METLTAEQYTTNIATWLRNVNPEMTDEELALFAREASKKHGEGWTLDEAKRYFRTFEEVSPRLPEDEALARRDLIVAAVHQRLGNR